MTDTATVQAAAPAAAPEVRMNIDVGTYMGFERAAAAPPRTSQLPPDPFAGYAGRLYPLPGGYSSYQELLSALMASPVLATCIGVRATITARMGWFAEKAAGAGGDPGQLDQLRRWIGDGVLAWRDGFGQVNYRAQFDRLAFGSGFWEALPSAAPPPSFRERARETLFDHLARIAGLWQERRAKDRARKVAAPDQPEARIAGMAHLPRVHVRLMRPEARDEGYGPSKRVVFDPLDLLYPRLMYSQRGLSGTGQTWGAVRYLKRFGDPRPINAYTGNPDENCPWEDLATEYLRHPCYWPGCEEGMPPWLPALAALEVGASIPAFYYNMLKRNCIPDIIVIVEGAEVANPDAQSKKIAEKFRETRQRRQNEGYEPKAMVLSFVVPPDPGNPAGAEPVPVKCRIEKLNPIDGPAVNALLQLQERNELAVAMALCLPPRFINYTTHGSLGGGGEAGEEFRRLTQTVIAPDQADIHDLLDQIVRDGRGIADWRVRLETPSLSDPKVEAEVAKAWSEVKGGLLDEVRDKIGWPPLQEAMTAGGEFDPGKVMLLGMGDAATTIEGLEALAGGLAPAAQGGLPDGSAREGELAILNSRSRLSPKQVVWLAGQLRQTLAAEIGRQGGGLKGENHGA